MAKGLLVIHVDGLSHKQLLQAVELGYMPFVKHLLENGHVALPYRCGLPSTTPYAQAGILYGDSSEIPSYRWYDKEGGLVVSFGSGSSFWRVADRYFQGKTPLTAGGACIAALYRAGANDRFGPKYHERHTPDEHPSDVNRRVIASFLVNPLVLYHWLRHGGRAFARITLHYLATLLLGRRAARKYVFADLFHEIVVHHLTRFAIRQAIDESVPVIYACVYTYDETAHAFGPENLAGLRILTHVDHTIRLSAERSAGRHELVVLSDHGQVECEQFSRRDGRRLGSLLAQRLPGRRVVEHHGGVFGPAPQAAAGTIAVTYSGGLAHVYLTDAPGRLDRAAIEAWHPGLIEWLGAEPRIDFVLVKDGRAGWIASRDGGFDLDGPLGPRESAFLGRLDEPDVIRRQLIRLNSFERSGDLIVFGHYDGRRQINFEDQVGGHGSAGGDQLHPFILARREWGWDTSGVVEAAELHPLLRSLVPRTD